MTQVSSFADSDRSFEMSLTAAFTDIVLAAMIRSAAHDAVSISHGRTAPRSGCGELRAASFLRPVLRSSAAGTLRARLRSTSVSASDDRTNDGRARRRWRVSGVVQGVGFRVATLRRAKALGVTGWVRNTLDGRVECVGEGTQAALEGLAEFLAVGPPGAIVTGVATREEPVQGHAGFEIDSDAEVA